MFLYLVITLIWAIIWGFVTMTINENKGYTGGFCWGFFLSIIGLIVVLCKPDNRSTYAATDTIKSSLPSGESYSSTHTKSNNEWICMCGRVNPNYIGTCGCGRSKDDPIPEGETPKPNNEWVCTCGRVNSKYIGTCACGKSKDDVKAYEEAKKKELEEKKRGEEELLNIQKLKSYKDLLDCGAITQEEYEKKKKELLDL